MKYVITGSTGNISKPLTEKLVAAGNDVIVISSKDDKRNEIESLGARAATGRVEDVEFLTQTFRGADAVYTMIPPTFTPSDWKKHIATIGQNYATAIESAGVKNVVNLSSIGAHLPEGCGPVSGLHFAEKALNNLNDVNILHLRPGFFYQNFLSNIGMVKNMGIVGGNYGNAKLTLAHPKDIAQVAATELLNLQFKGKSHRYIISDERTPDEIAKELGAAIGKPDLAWVDFTDEQNLGGMQQAGLPEEIAKNYTEMGRAMRTGIMTEHYHQERPGAIGRIKLPDFAKEFAAAYNG